MSLGPNPHKLVNGVKVLLTPEEIAEREAEIAAEAALKRVPNSVTPLQARRALRSAGLLESVNTWIASQPDEDIKDAWEFALVIERKGAITTKVAQVIGLTEEQLDSLFIEAALL